MATDARLTKDQYAVSPLRGDLLGDAADAATADGLPETGDRHDFATRERILENGPSQIIVPWVHLCAMMASLQTYAFV